MPLPGKCRQGGKGSQKGIPDLGLKGCGLAMARITWKVDGAADISAEVEDGVTLKDAALDNDVPYVIGECGGCLSCATCHVSVDSAWTDALGSPDFMEDDMLDFTEVERGPNSRLSCQIVVSDKLDGLVLHPPKP